MTKLKNFCDLSLNEKLMVLEWRNDISVRKWMYTSDIISRKNHLSFIEHIQDSPTTKYFLVFRFDEPIGVIYFNDINYNKSYCELGLYKNPNIKGIGSILLSEIISYVFEKLKLKRVIAEVFSENLKAISLYHKKNFKEYKRKEIKNKEIICMELKNENR